MSQDQAPSPPAADAASAIMLPRPNPGPEPWSAARPVGHPLEAVIGLGLAGFLLLLAARKWFARWRARRDLRCPGGLGAGVATGAEALPAQRLIASSVAVRLALVRTFGPAWAARTTEEVAADPTLAYRLGTELAGQLVAYLDQVDRAKFAGEECNNADQWIQSGADLVLRLSAAGTTHRPVGQGAA